MAAPPWDAGLQHRGRHQQLAQVHGPLVPHVRQDLHLHQQVPRTNILVFIKIMEPNLRIISFPAP